MSQATSHLEAHYCTFREHNSAVRMWTVLWVTSSADKIPPLLEHMQMIPDRLPYVKSKQQG